MQLDDICADSLADLLRAVYSQPPPPCEAFDCRYQKACARDKLACRAFQHYVSTGHAVQPEEAPTRRMFNLIETGHEYENGERRTSLIA